MGFIEEKVDELKEEKQRMQEAIELIDKVVDALEGRSTSSKQQEVAPVSTAGGRKPLVQEKVIEALGDSAGNILTFGELMEITGSKNIGRVARALQKKGKVSVITRNNRKYVRLNGLPMTLVAA